MTIAVEPKRPARLVPTPILQQTAFWSRVKARAGWIPRAFDLFTSQPGPRGEVLGDILVICRPVGSDAQIAYVPFGPEPLPDDSARGPWLESISESLRPHLPESCIFVRYDLPWESPYAREEDRYDPDGSWLGNPDPRIRELRMNWGTERGSLRKAPTDVLPPDTVFVDLGPDEDGILARMRAKTRYNIRLAERRGVRVRTGTPEDLEAWYGLYLETAARNGIARHEFLHFRSVFSVPLGAAEGAARPLLLLAERNGELLAGMILTISGRRATYLYGASSGAGRTAMAAYALQMEAIRRAKAAGCREYDLFGVAPRPESCHPMYGLYRFKTGFGGGLFHRQGCWDYPFDQERYGQYQAREAASAGFHTG